jgi:hypothetical protein
VITAIGEILNAADSAGQRYFSEDEKTDARQIVTSVKAGEPGLRELRGFRDFLAGELAKRENTRKAAPKLIQKICIVQCYKGAY